VRRKGSVAALVLLALFAAGCSDSSKVGSDLKVNGSSTTAACRLGECTTTTPPTAAPITTTTVKATATTRAPATTRPAQVTTTSAPQQIYSVKIYPDAAGHQFQPRVANVRLGTMVRWTNTDSVPRSVEADNGEFTSPPLAPGATFDYTPKAAGSINYHDGTRQYAVGTLDVG
jgi:plastocyanin